MNLASRTAIAISNCTHACTHPLIYSASKRILQAHSTTMATRILEVSGHEPLGCFAPSSPPLEKWTPSPEDSKDMRNLREAAARLRTTDIPVGFPTETVYGLGADATRSAAVRGIFAAKGRPADNPLIVHVCDLAMLRQVLLGGSADDDGADPIPAIYRPLIERFWPGPLTILLPLPRESSVLAPEVTAGLPTFGARMPASALARSLISLAGNPLAAPSANASTRPSPTTAQHVVDDLDGRIEVVLDGGPCAVGVESTVVDGMCSPPVVLRPGGVGIEELRVCEGWEDVEKAYKDRAEVGKAVPRAPGMKYKHYSPRARVVLFEARCEGAEAIVREEADAASGRGEVVGIVKTRAWERFAKVPNGNGIHGEDEAVKLDISRQPLGLGKEDVVATWEVDVGRDTRSIAQGLFAALRELDRLGADIIFVEGIDDGEDIAAAVMNRLRKAASDIRS
jgi:L-threonylcarbamoyladenylate synthase